MQDNIGVSAEEFAKRREILLEKMPVGSIALLPAGDLKYRNNDAEYPFRQESHFYYLTGFCEPNALLVLIKETTSFLYVLFCEESEPEKECWIGKRVGIEGAKAILGANSAYSINTLDTIMPDLLAGKQQIFYSLGHAPAWDQRLLGWVNAVRAKVKTGQQAPSVWRELLPLIQEARLIKSPSEIRLMQQAATISAEAHIQLMKACKPKMMEYELEAILLQQCYQKGCRAMAYSSIVGGGNNACTLHYVNNNMPLQSGDLVLVDAAGEYQYYAADITRTFPVNGRFSADQKLIYQLVLKAQVSAIEAVCPGMPWDKLQEIIVRIIVEGLVELGILEGNVDLLIEQRIYRQFYMHGSGHWLGLDVHDAGEYKIQGKSRVLEPGMVLTVEPGIYIDAHAKVDKRWQGIGIRIEDNILVTETGYQVLTSAVPKTIEDIEKLMANKG